MPGVSATFSIDANQAIASLNQISTLLTTGLGIAGIGLTIAGLKNLGETAHKATDLAEGLARNFGNVTNTMGTLRGAVQGAVSDINLMQGANEFALKGITSNVNDIAAVWQYAQVRAKEFGTTTTEEFSKLESAIIRPMMLKRLGIDIPESLKKTQNTMTNAQQRAMGLNLVLEHGTKVLDAYSKAGINILDPFEKFDAQMENLKQALGIAILPLLTKVFGTISNIIILLSGNNGLGENLNNSFSGVTDKIGDLNNEITDTAENISKLNKQIQDENESYNQSLYDIITGRQKQVADNKKQLDKQTADFNKSQVEAKKAETQKTTDMRRQLAQRIDDLRSNMSTFLQVGSSTYEADLAKYKEIIANEQAEGEKKIKEQEDLFASQTEAQQKEFDDSTADLKAKIKEDEDFLRKHAEEVKSINQGMLKDEIDQLKAQHVSKLAELNTQLGKEKDALKIGVDKMNTELGKLKVKALDPVQIKADLEATGKEILKAAADVIFKIATGLMKAGVESEFFGRILGAQIMNMPDKVKEYQAQKLTALNEIQAQAHLNLLMVYKEIGVPGYAKGVRGFSGGMALVGENGPELLELPKGSNIIPNNEMNSYSSKDITVNNFIDKGFDVDAFNNRLNFMLRTL